MKLSGDGIITFWCLVFSDFSVELSLFLEEKASFLAQMCQVGETLIFSDARHIITCQLLIFNIPLLCYLLTV